MYLFMPKTVIFEPIALQYPLGEQIYRYFTDKPVEILKTSLTNFSRKLSELSEKQRYSRSKTILAVTRNQQKKLEVCRPSADYQFQLVSNCPGSCEYCYLQTNQSYKPYLKAFVNLDEIWETISQHIPPNPQAPVCFEAASNGDPLAIEHITGSLGATIEHFGKLDHALLRVVTKYDNISLIADKKHMGHTRFRISLNTDYIIKQFEHRTSTLEERLEAAVKLVNAKYPIGFIIAPIMMYENWHEEYSLLFHKLHSKLGNLEIPDMTFELIQHRYTEPAKQRILERFPNTKLDMDESKRQLKWGKFGRFKYVYQKNDADELKERLTDLIKSFFPNAVIEYFT